MKEQGEVLEFCVFCKKPLQGIYYPVADPLGNECWTCHNTREAVDESMTMEIPEELAVVGCSVDGDTIHPP